MRRKNDKKCSQKSTFHIFENIFFICYFTKKTVENTKIFVNNWPFCCKKVGLFWSTFWKKKRTFLKCRKMNRIPMDTCDLAWPFWHFQSGRHFVRLKSSLPRKFWLISSRSRPSKNPCISTCFVDPIDLLFEKKKNIFEVSKNESNTHGYVRFSMIILAFPIWTSFWPPKIKPAS